MRPDSERTLLSSGRFDDVVVLGVSSASSLTGFNPAWAASSSSRPSSSSYSSSACASRGVSGLSTPSKSSQLAIANLESVFLIHHIASDPEEPTPLLKSGIGSPLYVCMASSFIFRASCAIPLRHNALIAQTLVHSWVICSRRGG